LVVGAGRGSGSVAASPGLPPLAGRRSSRTPSNARVIAAIERVVPVVPAELGGELGRRLGALAEHPKLGAAVAGGATRQESVRAGLAALGDHFALVAVHDAARPLLRAEDAARVVAAAARSGAAILAVPVGDTIKRRAAAPWSRRRRGASCSPRADAAGLPQRVAARGAREGRRGGPHRHRLRRARRGARRAVELVEGDPGNLKITHPADLERAARVLEARA
jgi:2-C-methyl-D-erythritol 4-phosphate cytidylyltransferase